MIYNKTTAWGMCLVMLLMACERPEAPDFSLEHEVQVPLTTQQTYRFLGAHDALIDTTDENFSDLFEVDQNGGDAGLVSLSKQEDLEFGELADALPEVDVDPTGVNSTVGEIKLGSFSSDGNIGSADFKTITGLDPGSYPQGQSIPGGNTPGTINIPFTTDNFVRAEIKSGALEISFSNNLGFNIDQLNLTLNAGATSLDSGVFFNFNDGTQVTWNIPFTPGTVLEDLNVDFSASWSNQTMNRNPQSLDVDNVAGDNLIASQVSAAIPPQDFSAGGSTPVDDTNFKFTRPDHYIELASGQLRIYDIINSIDLGIDELRISFPTIRSAPYTPADSLVVSIENIGRKCGCINVSEENISLADVRIYAEGNILPYTITGITEDTQQGNDIRTISENDSFAASVELNNLQIGEAYGVIVPRHVLVNGDAASDGVLDLFNDGEASVITLDGLENLSTQTDGLQFMDPVMSLLYSSNLDVETTIYAAIAGENSNGNVVYLTGTSGSEYDVSSSFPELQAGGQTLSPDKLIKFKLERPVGSDSTGAEIFDKSNTNADAFLNNLPSEIRFIGLAAINEPQAEGTVTDPVRFEPSFGVDVPLHFASELITFSDTTEADLSDLPDGNEQSLSEAKVSLAYTNGLPFGMDLNLIMLNEQKQPLMQIPLANAEPVSLSGATVNQESRFVEEEAVGKLELSLNETQLKELNKARWMVIEVSFNTTDQEVVKVRAGDTVTLSVEMSVGINSDIN